MGAIAQLRRGIAYRIGAWALLTWPSEELFDERVARLDRPAREVARRERHQRDVDEFLAHGWRQGEELRALIRAVGVTDGESLGRFLAALPAERQRELGIPCLGDHVVGAAHTCVWDPAQPVQATAVPV